MKHYDYTNDRDGRRGQIFPSFFTFVIWNEEELVFTRSFVSCLLVYNKMNFFLIFSDCILIDCLNRDIEARAQEPTPFLALQQS